MTDLKTGKDLAEWRKKNYISQKNLAAAIGYSASQIAHVESENRPLSKRLLKGLAEFEEDLRPYHDKLTRSWEHLKTNSDNLLFTEEIITIENSFSEILSYFSSIKGNNYAKKGSLLKLLSQSLSTLNITKDIYCSDDEDRIEWVTNRYRLLFSEARQYSKAPRPKPQKSS